VIEDDNGLREWYDADELLHRDGGSAVEWGDGTLEWFCHGLPHRDDGPAIVYDNGVEQWFRHGESIPAPSRAKKTCWGQR
jgi:hypothetical protein